MTERVQKRTVCKHCGVNGRWIEEGTEMVFVNVPGFQKHMCLKTKVDPIKSAVAARTMATTSQQVYQQELADLPPMEKMNFTPKQDTKEETKQEVDRNEDVINRMGLMLVKQSAQIHHLGERITKLETIIQALGIVLNHNLEKKNETKIL